MAIYKQFHFDNGPEGGSLASNNTAANGSVFNTVTTYKTITITSAAAFHGAYGSRYTNATNDYGTVGQWTVAPAAGTYIWCRTYTRIDRTNPANQVNVISWEPVNIAVQFHSDGKFRIEKATATTYTLSSAMSYAANTWYRIESMLYVHASTGQITVRVYAGDSTTLLEEFASTATFANTNTTTLSIAGAGIYGATAAFTVDADSVGVSDLGWMGPYVMSRGNFFENYKSIKVGDGVSVGERIR